jgi:PAS domain S-box-containing protein
MTMTNSTWEIGVAGMFLVDRAGIFRHWNEQAEELLGHSSKDVIGESLDMLVAESYKARHWEGFHKAMAIGSVKHDQPAINLPLKCSDGELKIVSAREIFLRDAFGHGVGVFVILSHYREAEGADNGLTDVYMDATDSPT